MSIFTQYWQTLFIGVVLYSLWSADLFETHLFGFYFYVAVDAVNNANLFISISMDSDYHNAVFVNVYGQQITHQLLPCFCPYICSLPCHTLFHGGDTITPSTCFNQFNA